MKNLVSWSIKKLRDAIKRKEVSIREVAEAYFERIEAVNPVLNTFLTVCRDHALQEAQDLDVRLRKRELKLGFLTGIPLAVKDNIITRDVRTTCGSKILGNYRPPYDATVVRRLKQDGALLLGKTNLDEFAMGSSTENSAFLPTRRIWSSPCPAVSARSWNSWPSG